ncbi:MAG TPA: hypothetical protein VGK73_10840 [Polyangiaceae bacterium]
MQGPLVAISICRECGVVAPVNGHACEVCRRPLGEVRAAAPAQPLDHCWVAVRCAFTCNSCRFLAPLDSLDADGAVECAHCGLRQRFEVERWREGLEFAHSVGDLAGPGPEGRNPHPVLWIGSENPHTPTGTTRTFEHATFGTLALDVAPGHPVCGRCRQPVNLSVPRPGGVETFCPRCGDRASHAISDAAVALCPALVAAVSEEHRSDRPRARATATAAGVVALTCPACGAPLELQETGTVHTCRYCRASCVVPHQSVARALHKTPEPAVWWLFFQGVSEERKALLAPAEPPADEAGEAAKKALRLLKLRKAKEVGDAPGVYEAPERRGRNYLQVALTLGLGGLAVAIGFAIFVLASTLGGK